MRKFTLLISVLCVIALTCSCGQKNTEKKQAKNPKTKSEVVVRVGDVDYNKERFNLYFYNTQDEILKTAGYNEASDIPEDFWDTKVDGITMLELAKEAAIELLIDDALEYQKAEEYNITLTAEDRSNIRNQMSALKQDKVSLAQFQYIGISVGELEEYYKSETLMPKLLLKLIDEGEIKLDEQEVAEQFESSYFKVKQIFLATIDTVTRLPLPQFKVEAAKEKAQQVMDKISEGEDFDELMYLYSEDPYLGALPDGYVFAPGEWDPQLEEVALSLGQDEVSGLITTDEGIHILKRAPFDFEGTQEAAYLENIETQLASTRLEGLIKKWKSKTKIKVYYKAIEDLKPTITNNRQPPKR